MKNNYDFWILFFAFLLIGLVIIHNSDAQDGIPIEMPIADIPVIWISDSEWVKYGIVPIVVTAPAECEQLRKENEYLKRENCLLWELVKVYQKLVNLLDDKP